MNVKARLRETLRRRGIDVKRYRSLNGYDLEPFFRRAALLARHDIEQVVDVGANVGQYAAALRLAGFAGRIVSYEPLSEPFESLAQRAADDPDWECRRQALGPTEGTVKMNVAAHHAGSSVLTPHPLLVSNIPQMEIVAHEDVPSTPLDSLADEIAARRTMLKLDVQGFHQTILESGPTVQQRLSLLELEASVQPLYDGEPALADVLQYATDRGFRLIALDPGVVAQDLDFPLQFDAFFERPNGD